MSNEVVKYQMPHQEVMEMAKLFVESKMFEGVSQVAAAFVKIQAGKEIGIAPFAAMSGIHIIQGKVAIGAGLMAGALKGSAKYDYRVNKMDNTICSIDFLQAGKLIGNSTFTIEDAKKANTKNIDKFPRNMLFARAMSNGVRWFTPDIFTMPVYTPEELGTDIKTDDVDHTELPTPPDAVATKPEVVQKKTLTAKAFNGSVDRIKAGEVELIEKIKETFILSEEQLKALDELAPKETVPAEDAPQS